MHTFITFYTEVLAITVAPRTLTVNEADPAQFSCSLACECSGAMLQWRASNGSALPPSAAVTFTDNGRTAILTFDSATMEVEGEYLCVAVDVDLGTVTESVVLEIAGDR